jgi:DNA primase
MNNLEVATQIIKDNISAIDVGIAIGLEIKHGRCKCPLHGGQNYNCVLYHGNRGFYCHQCKRGGDVISFVQQYYNMQFPNAIQWFNDTFNLGIDIYAPLDIETLKRAEKLKKAQKQRAEFQEWKDRMQFNLALTAEDIVRRLENVRDEKRPRTYGEWDEEFCTAVELLPDARRFADDCMMYCMEVRKC